MTFRSNSINSWLILQCHYILIMIPSISLQAMDEHIENDYPVQNWLLGSTILMKVKMKMKFGLVMEEWWKWSSGWWINENVKVTDDNLDVECGNGVLLLELSDEGFLHLNGVDY